MDRDTLWRAEKKEKRADGSVYSMKKVQASKGGKKGKSRASDGEADAARTRLGGTAEEVETEHAEENAAAADDEDRYGTVASYRTAAEADAEDGLSDVDEQKGNGALSPEDEDDSGHETPTGPAISGRKRVQDIWPSSPGGEARRGRKQVSVLGTANGVAKREETTHFGCSKRAAIKSADGSRQDPLSVAQGFCAATH